MSWATYGDWTSVDTIRGQFPWHDSSKLYANGPFDGLCRALLQRVQFSNISMMAPWAGGSLDSPMDDGAPEWTNDGTIWTYWANYGIQATFLRSFLQIGNYEYIYEENLVTPGRFNINPSTGQLRIIPLNNAHKAIFPYFVVVGDGSSTNVGWYPYRVTSAFDYILDNTITSYVDHTQAVGGSFNGQANIPQWSVASIYAHLGEAKLGIQQTHITAEWVYQKYKVLNLLRWVQVSINGANGLGASNGFVATKLGSRLRAGGSDVSSWAQAVIDWNNATWGVSYVTPGVFIEHQGCHNTGPARFQISRHRYESQNSYIQTMKPRYQFYGKMLKALQNAPANIYENNDYAGTIENTLYAVDNKIIDDTYNQLEIYGNINSVTATQPPADQQHGWRLGGYSGTATHLLRYDEADCFTYKDW